MNLKKALAKQFVRTTKDLSTCEVIAEIMHSEAIDNLPLSRSVFWKVALIAIVAMFVVATGCSSSEKQPEASGGTVDSEALHVSLPVAVEVEEAMAHLAVSETLYDSGDVYGAQVHAGHAASENVPDIAEALSADSTRVTVMRGHMQELVDALDESASATVIHAKYEQIRSTIADARAVAVDSDVSGSTEFGGLLCMELLNRVVDEYGEGVSEGEVRNLPEYQDAFGFFGRAKIVWSAIEDDVRDTAPLEYVKIEDALHEMGNAVPAVAAPASLAIPSDVEASASLAVKELEEVFALDANAGHAGTGVAGGGKLDEADEHLETVADRLNAGDVAGASTAYAAYEDAWYDAEDAVRASSRDYYRLIEGAMGEVMLALRAERPDAAKISAALVELRHEIAEFDEFDATAASSAGSISDGDVTLNSVAGLVDSALSDLDAGNPAQALAAVDKFRYDWVTVEGLVKAKSAADYSSIENDMALARSLLSKNLPDTTGARDALIAMQTTLEPYAGSSVRYGVFDSAAILLREGLEALLILGALLAFLKKIGQADKSKWVWAGSGAGVAASVVIAIAVTALLAGAAAAGTNRELLEGVTGLFAAVMLIYMSYWLHTNANLAGWRRYVQEKMTIALQRNRLISLALIAFLAVFREGAETVLFYIGIAPATALSDLLLGILIALVILVVVGVAVIRYGARLPLKPFFTVASLMVLYLAFKFVGNGIHALQVADVMQATASESLPSISFFGIFPTWETTIAQLALAAVVVGVLTWRRFRPATVETAPATPVEPVAGS
jgi:high-affinity iron transporter